MGEFKKDLYKERVLSTYLDDIYYEISDNNAEYIRVNDMESQHKGVDLEIIYKSKKYLIDEKAQLSFINKNLPTFTFELSYLKNNELKVGWFLDQTKLSDRYFLITSIHLHNGKKELRYKEDIQSIKITSVDVFKLKQLLSSKGLTGEVLRKKSVQIRRQKVKGNIITKKLIPKTEGCFFYSPQLVEKPINLKLYLSFLIDSKVAKILYNPEIEYEVRPKD